MDRPSNVLFLAWQDPRERRWYTIGRLSQVSDGYRFAYTKGFQKAATEAGLKPIPGFARVGGEYRSEELFPHFQNRVMPRSRPDFAEYLARLHLNGEPEPFTMLARSEGRRSTDSFEVFACPEVVEAKGEKLYSIHFFIHGLRHTPPATRERAAELQPGERLYLMADCQNPFDEHAITIRTEDNYMLGWIPRYYCRDLLELRLPEMEIRVERVNPPPVEFQQRVLCRLVASWPEEFQPCAQSDYEPLIDSSPDPTSSDGEQRLTHEA